MSKKLYSGDIFDQVFKHRLMGFFSDIPGIPKRSPSPSFNSRGITFAFDENGIDEKSVSPGRTVYFSWERENEYDEYAHELLVKDTKGDLIKIGYMPKELASHYIDQLKMGRIFRGIIEESGEVSVPDSRKPSPFIRIKPVYAGSVLEDLSISQRYEFKLPEFGNLRNDQFIYILYDFIDYINVEFRIEEKLMQLYPARRRKKTVEIGEKSIRFINQSVAQEGFNLEKILINDDTINEVMKENKENGVFETHQYMLENGVVPMNSSVDEIENEEGICFKFSLLHESDPDIMESIYMRNICLAVASSIVDKYHTVFQVDINGDEKELSCIQELNKYTYSLNPFF